MDESRELDTSTFDRGVEMVNDVNPRRIKDSFQSLSFFFFPLVRRNANSTWSMAEKIIGGKIINNNII